MCKYCFYSESIECLFFHFILCIVDVEYMESMFTIDRTRVKAKLAQKVTDDRKRHEHAEELRKKK